MLQPKSVTLLIVEMDDGFRRSLAERLVLAGYRVLEACEESELKRVIEAKSVDVVLLGVGGFRQRGLAMLQMIKERRPSAEVILLTPAEDHSLALSMEGMRRGAFDDILVPLDMETLIERILEAHKHKTENVESRRAASRANREKHSSR